MKKKSIFIILSIFTISISGIILSKIVFADTPQQSQCQSVIDNYIKKGCRILQRCDHTASNTSLSMLENFGVFGVYCMSDNTLLTLMHSSNRYMFIVRQDCTVRGVDLSN